MTAVILVLLYVCDVLRGCGVYSLDYCYGSQIYLLPDDGQTTVSVRRMDNVVPNVMQMVTECENRDPATTVPYTATEIMRDVTDLIWAADYFPPLPDNSSIVRVAMMVKIVGEFGGCSNLIWLRIRPMPGSSLSCPAGWLARCSQLRKLKLELIHVVDARAVLDTTPPLRALTLELKHLLDLSALTQDPIFPTPSGREQSITELTITGRQEELAASDHTSWSAVSAAIAEQLATLPRLQNLTISMITGFDLCPSGMISSVTLRSLERLTVLSSNTTRVCFGELRAAPRLTHLTLEYPAGSPSSIQFRELFSVRAPTLDVDIYQGGRRDFLEFHIEQEDYMALIDGSRRGNATFPKLQVSVDCEWCRSGWLARALREGLVTAPGVSCRDGRAPQHLRSLLECDRIACAANCKCWREWHGGVVVADCSGARPTLLPAELLRLPNLTVLIANDHHISQLQQGLPDSILRVELSVLSPLSPSTVSALFDVHTRRVRLALPLECTCDHRPTLQALQLHKLQVEDYKNLTCVGTKTKLDDVNVMDLCKSRDLLSQQAAQREAELTAAVGAALAAAVGALCVAAAVYWRRALRAFLFARGYCLCCLREDALDADRRYDVFLSYCHADHQMVLEKLLPVLDGEYSVCEHTRDWCPGEAIPAQIMWSVEQSRRTLVVLSRSFVESLWGVLEFRTAHASGLSTGRVRVVMVVLDDVLESGELHGELRAYVRLNTYVRWGEPFFWDKLRYALPHRPAPAQLSHDPRPPHTPKMEVMAAIAAGRHHTSPLVRQRDTLASPESDETPAAPLSAII